MITEDEKAALRQDFSLFTDGWQHLDFELTVREDGADPGEPVLHLVAGRHREEEEA